MTQLLHWGFLNRITEIEAYLAEDVAWSFTCHYKEPHEHTVECIWVWHYCDMNIHPERVETAKRIDDVIGWKPGGISAHTLHSLDPFHIEPSIYWPDCCGMHGYIREGRYLSV